MVKLVDITPATLKQLPDAEVRLAWLRLHQWYSAAKEAGQAIENYVNAARWTINELQRRDLDYDATSELARRALALGKQYIAERFNALPADVVVVKDFVCVVGSAAKKEQGAGDIDVLFRAKRDAEDHFLLQSDNVWLQVRKALDPDKEDLCHFIDNPQGPHDDFTPLYDLVLRRKPCAATHIVKSGAGVYTAFKVREKSAHTLYDWAKQRGLANITEPDKMHCTTVYSREPFDDYLPCAETLTIDPQTYRWGLLGEHQDLVLHFEHARVRAQHDLARRCGASWDYESFEPHITVCYGFTGGIPQEVPSFGLQLGDEYLAPLDTEWKEKAQPGLGDVHVPSGLTIAKKPKRAALKPILKLAKPISSPGGKDTILDAILKRIPEHDVYVEPYVGGGSIFWRKEPSDREIIADINGDIIAIYRFLKNGTDADFTWMRDQRWEHSTQYYQELQKAKPTGVRERAYRYKYLNLFGRRGDIAAPIEPSHTARNCSGQTFLANLENYRERLAKVRIIEGSAIPVIRLFDGPRTFFYLDPPWKPVGRTTGWRDFDEPGFIRAVAKIKGKALISYQGDLPLKSYKSRTVTTKPRGFQYESTQKLYWNYDAPYRSVAKDLAELPIKLDLGCGEHRAPGYIGIDHRPGPTVDMAYDLTRGIPYGDESVDVVRASHFLEHVPADAIMREIHRVLKPGGRLEFEVPSTGGEGAFAHPEHVSFWNASSFAFWCDADYVEDRPQFEIEELEEYGEPPRVYVRGVLRKPYAIEKTMVRPFQAFVPPKPQLAGLTEIFSVDELWDWAKDRLPVAVGPKWNGFRVIAERQGDRLRVWSEGQRSTDLAAKIPMLRDALDKLPGDWVLDADLGIERDGQRLPRPELMRFNRDEIEFAANEHPVLTVFDMPYYNEPLGDQPFSERKKKLEALTIADKKHLRVSPDRVVTTRPELLQAVRWGLQFHRSEGVVAKAMASAYPTGGTPEWSKLKRVVELKVKVLDKKPVKGGGWNYRGGLTSSAGQRWTNIVDGLVDLGWSFNTAVEANKGDIITVHVLEVVPDETAHTLTWLGANVIDVDRARTTPYSAMQAIDIAQRGRVLQKQAAPGVEGDTRADIAETFWRRNWDKVFPKSGTGRFVYQHHWRGLDEDQTQLGEAALLNTDHSVHGDLRFEGDGELWGFSVFTGTAAENKRVGGDKLIALKDDANPLRGTFKLAQPVEWLEVGIDKPYVSEPGGVGATTQKWSTFFALDSGRYRMGVRNRSFVEVFLEGDKLKGRYLIQNVPIEGGRRRAWMLSKPADQKPFAQTHDRQEEIDRLRRRGHTKLIWAQPGETPQVINLLPIHKEFAVAIFKRDDEQQLITGVVMEPDEVDAHGDWTQRHEIEQAAHRFLVRSRVVGLQHSKQAPVHVVESYITPDDMMLGGQKVRKNSWIMTVKVNDEKLWKDVKKGVFTGFSVGGMAMRRNDNARANRSGRGGGEPGR